MVLNAKGEQAKGEKQRINMLNRKVREMKIFKLPSSITFVKDNKMVYGEYLAKMENCVWTIGYTRRNSGDFAICVIDQDYESAKEQLKNELIRLGQFN